MASKRARVLLGTILGIALVFAGLGFYVRHQAAPVSSRFAPQLVKLREPQSPEEIAKTLQKRHVVRNPSLLARWLKWKGKSTIAAGDYEFSPDQSMWQIADILIHERFTVNWVSFPEGWTMARIAARLSERGIADEAEFLALCQNRSISMERRSTRHHRDLKAIWRRTPTDCRQAREQRRQCKR